MTNNEFYEKNGYLVIPNFIPGFFAQFLREYFDTLKHSKKLEAGDMQVSNSECVYGDACYDTLMLMSTHMISKYINIDLTPTYTYARIYYNNAELLPHLDRDECEHSVSLFLGGEFDATWPIWMLNKEVHKEPNMLALNIGDCVIYKGNKVHHWRDAFLGTSHYQLFMHYVETNGKFKHLKFDTRPYLGMTSDTKSNTRYIDDQ